MGSAGRQVAADWGENGMAGWTADLSEQVALVTGASQGIGRAVALELARNGARVACVARSVDKLAQTVDAIRQAGGTAEAFACDVRDRDSVEKTVEGVVALWQRLDILVNNAGVTRDTLLPRMTDEEWDEVIQTNLRGAFLFARAVSRHMMRARYGRIINMTSVSGLIGNPGQTNYSASKAGLIGLTRSLSRELASRQITINAVAPGFIESDMTRALGPALLEEAKKRIPARRLGTPEDVAAAVLFLASPAAGYITGHVLVVDGGMTG
ncbi:MAG: beta-ketoacyl-ACP reductase [Pirellulaceae bacterium]|nr:MAG: beta-ketoacyl-ACP reductase [Pirellulaceae bacterium]GIW96533.1 MAG: beta-ketoacyl-ACP reductase [Pirellulaceae bacterium]